MLPLIGQMIEAKGVYEHARSQKNKDDASASEPAQPVHHDRPKKAAKAEDNTPIQERLEKIGSHLRKNAVAGNYGSDASLKVADNIYSKYVQSSVKQEGLLKKASDDQRDVLESLSASMIRFRKDEKGDTKKFQQEMLAVLQQTYAADGDDEVKKYVEEQITDAINSARKMNGISGSVHKWMTKDSEKNKDSWLFRTIAGTETAQKGIDSAKNAGIALNEQDKLNARLSGLGKSPSVSAESEKSTKLENLLHDMMKSFKEMRFPDKIDVLNVNKLIVGSVERGQKKSAPGSTDAASDFDGPVKPRPKTNGRTAQALSNGILMPAEQRTSLAKRAEFEDVDYREVPRVTKRVGYKKPLALGYDEPAPVEIPPSPIKPKYQGKLRTKETAMASAVRSAMNVGPELPIRQKNVSAALVGGLGDELSTPVMNKFESYQDRSSSNFAEKKVEPTLVEPKADESDAALAAGLGSLIPDIDLDRRRGRGTKKSTKPMKPKAKGSKLGRLVAGAKKAKPFLKTAGKGLAVLGAGAAVFGGVSETLKGGKVQSLADIIPKGGLLDKLNPAEYAMNAGRYAGDKVNKGYEGLSKGMGGSGSIGSDVYDLINKPKAVPKSSVSPNVQGNQLAASSAKAKEMTMTNGGASGPTIIQTAPAAAPVKSSGTQPALVSGFPRNRESYFDRQMNKTFTAL